MIDVRRSDSARRGFVQTGTVQTSAAAPMNSPCLMRGPIAPKASANSLSVRFGTFMLSFFRRFLGSRVGAFIALGFLAIIALAFAAGDITNHGGLGILGGAGGNAAKVGGSTLSAGELQQRIQRVFEQQRRANPGMVIAAFLAQRGAEQVYDQMVAGLTITEFADDQGMSVSKRMVDAEIAAIPAFQDASGAFSQDAFRQLLARENISEKAIRADIARDLIGKQLIGPAGLGVKLTDSLVLPYASLLLETRSGRIAAIPAVAFANVPDPTEAQLTAYYTAQADRFTVPEQRRLRYAIVDSSRFTGAAQPTEAEIAAAYAKNKASYAASETRTIERLVLPTEAAAKTIEAQVKGGATLAAAAQKAGLATATLPRQTKADIARDGTDAIATAVYAAPENALVGPLRAPLGWQLLRVTKIERTPARPLDQVKGELTAQLADQKQQQLLSDFTSKVEDQIANGATFDEAVKDNGLSIETTPFVLATGQSVEVQGYRPSPDVGPLLKPAFDMASDDDAQLVPLTPNKRYALLKIGETRAAAPPPLAKVRPVIVQQYKINQGFLKAKAVAEQIRAKVQRGMALDAALQAMSKTAGVALPAPQAVSGQRAQLLSGGKRPPAELALLFAMPQGSVKSLAMSGNDGYYVIQLNQIQRGDAGRQPALVDNVRNQLNQVVGGEYNDQFERDIEKLIGVKRNPAAVAQVKQDLRRANGLAQ